MKSQISLTPHKPEAAESAPRSPAPVKTLLHKILNRYAAVKFRVVLKYWSVSDWAEPWRTRGHQGSAADPQWASSSPTNVAYWVLNDMHEWKSLLFPPTFPVCSSSCSPHSSLWVPNNFVFIIFESWVSQHCQTAVIYARAPQESLRCCRDAGLSVRSLVALPSLTSQTYESGFWWEASFWVSLLSGSIHVSDLNPDIHACISSLHFVESESKMRTLVTDALSWLLVVWRSSPLNISDRAFLLFLQFFFCPLCAAELDG